MIPLRWGRIDALLDLLTWRISRKDKSRFTGEGTAEEIRNPAAGHTWISAGDTLIDSTPWLLKPVGKAGEQTGSWPLVPPDRPARSVDGAESVDDDSSGFSPKAVIAPGSQPFLLGEAEAVARARLREMPIILIALVAMAAFWRSAVLGDNDLVLRCLDAIVIATLGGMVGVLYTGRRLTLGGLRALELGMVGVFAGRLAVVQYRLMLLFSLKDDPMMAQLIMKNIVLLEAILILTYGLYVPKTFGRAAFVAALLAFTPFATLWLLFERHRDVMGWIGRGWGKSETPRIFFLSFDAMILLVLAVGVAFGASVFSRLRRQVAEAKQLGQYRLRRLIGAGGMGEVYLAEHRLLKRPCALKLIRPRDMADARALERFQREVRLTAKLSHPNTVEIYDYGRAEDGTYYYVMEYLPGLSLEELVGRRGPLPAGRVVYLLRQICQALAEAHAAGLIHRDIKPSNIFAARRGGADDVAKLLDFGLVHSSATERSARLSEEGQIVGTPLFMSPEQARGRVEIDERSDIYSLGAVAYFLLTGRPPFDEVDGLAALIAVLRDPIVPPSRFHADIPIDLEQVVLRCLSKVAADRFPSADSLERALRECECADDWDQEHAVRWWREGHGKPTADPTTVLS